MATVEHLTTPLEVFIECDIGSDVYGYRVALNRQTEGCGRVASRSIAEGHAYSVLARLRREHPSIADTKPTWHYRERGGVAYRRERVTVGIEADDRLQITLHESPSYHSLVDLADLLERQPLLRRLSGRDPLLAAPSASDGVADLTGPLAHQPTARLYGILAHYAISPQLRDTIIALVAEIAAAVRLQTLSAATPAGTSKPRRRAP